MKIILDVSDKLFNTDINDRFQDFFGRVISDIAFSLNNDSSNICGRYEMETAELLKSSFANAVYTDEVGV